MLSINRGLGSFNLRDVFLNFHYDDRLMLKFGRYKTPYTYEVYAISNTDLLSPERSLYAMNIGLNREIGMMGWGQLFDKRLDYAAGIFNGPRNGFEDFNNAKDVIAYLNARPFGTSEIPFLDHLNIGGSVDFGSQNNPLLPEVFRTATNASNSDGANAAAPALLAFNPNVREVGERALWNLHLAYFYKGLSVLAEWDSGFLGYATTNRPDARVRLPVGGYYASAGYFLTGETVTRRTQVKPIRPFDLRQGKFGLGAWEVHGRYSALNLDDRVFTAGLADGNLWTNDAYAIDLGLNWYINQYLKVYFDWQHAVFGRPVIAAPGFQQKTSDLFWLRAQLYF
jgi:phosphate-selective porin OprO/OprP